DLGAFYLDVLKDRLYTCGRESPARRSAQNALYHVTQSLLRLMAPVLSFTAEEAWKIFRPAEDTVFAQVYYRLPEVPGAEGLLARWRSLREVRSKVQKILENHRAAGEIGSSLQAEVDIAASGERLELLQGLGDDLRFVLITSRAGVIPAATAADESIRAVSSKHRKCERCWHYRADVDSDPKHPGICGRCVLNLYGAGEPRSFA
ncbi:MAG: isoleucine--tRNA ligase, partial [Betaproteobacteria bacterium]